MIADLSIWATAIATIATAVATAVLAVVTWSLYKATQRMASASDPNVVATIESARWAFNFVDLVVENCGAGPAYDVRISFDPTLLRESNGDRTPLPIGNIAVLRPGQIFRNSLGRAFDILNDQHHVSVSWKRSPASRERLSNDYDFHLNHLKDLVQLGGGDPLVQIAEETEKTRRAIERITDGRNRMGVNAYSQSDRDQERADQERSYNERAALRSQSQVTEKGDKSE